MINNEFLDKIEEYQNLVAYIPHLKVGGLRRIG